jgi:hypothetical protein
MLEARMVVAATQDGTWGDRNAPSPEEIIAARDAISAAWDDEERECRRKGYVRTSVIIDERQKAYKRAWAEANRDKIRERVRAYNAANREKINARVRAAHAANRD